MARVIASEFAAILRTSIAQTAAIVRITGVLPAPEGPRVRWELTRSPDPADTRLTPDEVRDIAEAASRYVAVRWRDSAEPRPVPNQSWDKLMQLFPRVYDAPPETGDGWHWLLVAAAEWMSEGGLPREFNTEQVNEKFGQLRFYHEGSATTLRIARAVEQISYGICEICGAPGSLRKSSWMRTACDAHAPKK